MRKLKIYTYLIVILLSAGIYSCDNMSDIYIDYVKDGETVYLVKPDSVSSYPGNKRVLIQCILKNAYNVEKIWAYYNEGHDSVSFDYSQKESIDSLNLIITGLEEKSYIFDLYTKNSDGNRSIRVSTFATAYGDRYEESLYPRIATGFSFDTLNATMSWLASEESERMTQVKYTNTSGVESILSLSTDTSKLFMPDFSDLGAISYRSFYKPEPIAIDSFATAWTSFELPAAYAIYKTVNVTPKTGGATVTWDNPDGIVVSVKVQYTSNTGVLQTKVFKTSPGTIIGINTTPRDFKVTVADALTNLFGPKIFNLTPL